MKLERYSAYRDSGIEWLGEIPEHWEVKKLKYVVNIHGGNGFPIHEQGNTKGKIPFFKVSDINGKSIYINQSNNYVSDNTIKNMKWNLIPSNSIVTAKIGEALRKNHRKITSVPSIIDNNCIAFEPKSIEAKFNYYLHKIIDFDWFSNVGTVPSISVSRYKNFKCFIPPKQEQQKIASFLDKKTKQLDQVIEQKEQLIELLKERRQILINDAVTKGLDRTVGFKDSGVEWIGEIPEGWEVKRLKYVSKIVLGKMICNNKSGIMELKPYLKSKNIQWLKVNIESVDNMWFTKQEMQEYRLKTNDLILSEGGEVGKTCIWNNELPECYIQNSAHKVTISPLYIPHYYLYLLSSIGHKGVFESIVSRVSIGHLTKNKLSNIFVLVPPKQEQQQIVNHIEKNNQKIDKAITLQQQQIKKLKEYKTTLIDSVVTGKVKVS